MELFRKSIALALQFAGAHDNLAFSLLNLNQPEEAMAEFRKTLELNPKSAMSCVALAQ